MVSVLLLMACDALGSRPIEGNGGTTDSGDSGASTEHGLDDLQRCTMSPALVDRVTDIESAPDGDVWLITMERDAWRYTREAGADCALTGTLVAADVLDLDVDTSGQALMQVGLTELVAFDAAGLERYRCEPEGLGHALVVDPTSADRAWVWAVGQAERRALALGAEGCAQTGVVAADREMGIHASVSGRGLHVDNHLDEADIPGSRYELEGGALLGDLGLSDAETLQRPSLALGVLAREEGAWWVDGDLHDLADDGRVYRYHEAESFAGEGSYLTALGGAATGAIYVAATFGDDAPPAMWRFLPR